jgi:hypothetical protein
MIDRRVVQRNDKGLVSGRTIHGIHTYRNAGQLRLWLRLLLVLGDGQSRMISHYHAGGRLRQPTTAAIGIAASCCGRHARRRQLSNDPPSRFIFVMDPAQGGDGVGDNVQPSERRAIHGRTSW